MFCLCPLGVPVLVENFNGNALQFGVLWEFPRRLFKKGSILQWWFALIVLGLKTLEWVIPHAAGWRDWIGRLCFKCCFVILRTWYEGGKCQMIDEVCFLLFKWWNIYTTPHISRDVNVKKREWQRKWLTAIRKAGINYNWQRKNKERVDGGLLSYLEWVITSPYA